MRFPRLGPRSGPPGDPRCGLLAAAGGRVPWVVALLVSVSVTLVVAFPLFLWARDGAPASPVPARLVERHAP
jgi:hypothetical protein